MKLLNFFKRKTTPENATAQRPRSPLWLSRDQKEKTDPFKPHEIMFIHRKTREKKLIFIHTPEEIPVVLNRLNHTPQTPKKEK